MAPPKAPLRFVGVPKNSASFLLMKQMGCGEGEGLGKDKQGIKVMLGLRISKKLLDDDLETNLPKDNTIEGREENLLMHILLRILRNSSFRIAMGIRLSIVSGVDTVKKLAPEYERLGASFKNTKFVDCDEHKEVCTKYKISGYPTIKWFPKGSLEPKEYDGVHIANALVEYINSQAGTNIKIG
ncbi:hypothetical protein L1987_48483 [Smallanthus sonchifolius]|uniref:Uncharacterized protein n=1 Tax=Smallanthus sonchifolius TaxID=185202 RepID=A0ACB9FS28_9ASTR|nr:hypothetical protein L1987_48483 [Smallanthus sonchifolius]